MEDLVAEVDHVEMVKPREMVVMEELEAVVVAAVVRIEEVASQYLLVSEEQVEMDI
jgi:hypothetical protein